MRTTAGNVAVTTNGMLVLLDQWRSGRCVDAVAVMDSREDWGQKGGPRIDGHGDDGDSHHGKPVYTEAERSSISLGQLILLLYASCASWRSTCQGIQWRMGSCRAPARGSLVSDMIYDSYNQLMVL
jgi:hypothetical protein